MTTPDIECIEHMMATGEMLPAQMGTQTSWSAEKRLAGAVLASALVCIRDHHGDERYEDDVAEDLAWICSDDTQEPFSFLRLCDLFALEPVWVRERVEHWRRTAPSRRRRFSLRRDAA